MNIQKEIDKFYNFGYQSLLDELTQQQEDLKVKKYLFNVLNNINELDKHIKSGLFQKKGIEYMLFKQDYEYDIGAVLSKLEILDKDKSQMNKYCEIGNYSTEYNIIYELFSHHYLTLVKGLFNADIEKKEIIIELDEHTKEHLKNYLLNEELRKAYEYVELLAKMPAKNTVTTRKNKI